MKKTIYLYLGSKYIGELKVENVRMRETYMFQFAAEYLNPKNFTKDPMKVRQGHDVLNKVKRQIRVNGKQHSATIHYSNNYGYIPLWVLVKVLSFGIVSELYTILKPEDQLHIADFYDIKINTLETYLSLLFNTSSLFPGITFALEISNGETLYE